LDLSLSDMSMEEVEEDTDSVVERMARPAAPTLDSAEFFRQLREALPAQQQYQPSLNFKLPQFWPERPAAWFGMVECQFHLRKVIGEMDKYCLVVSALPDESVKLVSFLLEQPPTILPYTTLKQQLLATHQLTPYQQMEQLFNVEPLGGRKPSELLAAMLALCPKGEEQSSFFSFLFLQRLPRELRVLLAEDDHKNLRALADKADKLHALQAKQAFDCAAAVEELPDTVAAITGKQHKKKHHKQGNKTGSQPSSSKQQASNTPKGLARKASGLCFYHWTFGEAATRCEAPCTWQGN